MGQATTPPCPRNLFREQLIKPTRPRITTKNNMLKRTNWTTEEIIEILKDRLRVENLYNLTDEFNMAIESLLDEFEACLYPEESFGAFAYDTEKKEFVHIGLIPENCKAAIKRK